MEPFDVLAEETPGHPVVPLPPELARIYGGDLRFAEECVYANFVATLDGVVSIPSLPNSNTVVAGDNDADRFLMGLLRALADVVLIGAGVLRASPKSTWRAEQIYPPAADAYATLRASLDLPPAPEVAVLCGWGHIDPDHPVLGGRALVLTSDRGVTRLENRLPTPRPSSPSAGGCGSRATRSSTRSARAAIAGSSPRPVHTRSARSFLPTRWTSSS